MDDKYKLLTQHLNLASRMGREAANSVDDGGSANLDSVFLKLKGYNEKKTIEAINAAGLNGDKTTWIGTGYMICPPSVGQGNKRAKCVEIMADYLSGHYKVLTFYHLD